MWLNAPKRRRPNPSSTCNPTTVFSRPTAKPSSNTLKNAPERSNLKLKYQNVRKKLFNHGQQDAVTTEMIDLLPVVLKKLQHAGLFGDFYSLLRLISKDQFPLHNTSFLLSYDAAHFSFVVVIYDLYFISVGCVGYT